MALKLPWIDAVKGVCICLVVLGHSTGFYPALVGHDVETIGPIWASYITALAPIRLASFFMISGYLSRRAIERPWRQLLAGRVGTPVYVYAVWLCIFVLIFQTVMPFPLPQPDYTLTAFLHPMNHLWYLWALALFIVIAKLARHAPTWIMLGASCVLSLCASTPEIPVPDGVAANLFYFLIGVLLTDSVTAVADRARTGGAVALVVAYGAGVYTSMRFFDHVPAPISMALSVLGIIMLVQVVAVACRKFASPMHTLRGVGQRTQAVYVMHIPLLVLIMWTERSLPRDAIGPVLLIIYPFIATSLAVSLALALKALLDRVGASRFLLELPGFVRRPLAGNPL